MKIITAISKLIFVTLFFALMIFFFHPQVSYANAPQDVKIEYDSGSQTLAVIITHKSPFTYTYKVEAVQGDKLEVTATCNLSGSKTATITVSPAANAGK